MRERQSVPSSRTSQFRSPIRYRKTTLPGGLRVVTEEIPSVRSVSVGIWLNVGSRDEAREENGVAHFVEHMVFKGSKRFSATEIARSLESVGGYLNAFTTKEATCYYAHILDQHLERAIDVLSDMVQYPRFDAHDIAKEKEVVFEELRNIEDNPDDLIHDYFDRIVFGDHPLARPVIGSEESVRSFDRHRLNEFVRRHYLPHQMVIAVTGNLTHEKLVPLVEKYFHKLLGTSGTRKRPRAKASPWRRDRRMYEYEKPISQAHICMGVRAMSLRSPHRYPLLVLNTLLGEGMSSRLFQKVREHRGLAYNVYSFLSLLSDTGVFGVYVGTDKSKIDASIELVRRELDSIASKGIGKAELRRTKEQLKGTMMLSLESTSNRMMRLGSGELFLNGYTTLDRIVESIDAVTLEDVHQVAERLFRDSEFSTIIFRPAEAVESNRSIPLPSFSTPHAARTRRRGAR